MPSDKLSPMMTAEARILYENALRGFSLRLDGMQVLAEARQQILEDYSRSLLEACYYHARNNDRAQMSDTDINYAIRIVPQDHIISQLGRFP